MIERWRRLFMRRTHDFELFMWFLEKSSSVCSMAVLSDLIVSDGGNSATEVFIKIMLIKCKSYGKQNWEM
jgi:hypothetical protein